MRINKVAEQAGLSSAQRENIERMRYRETMKARCLLLLTVVAMAMPVAAFANDDLERAIDAYERSHYAESVQLLHLAAEGGNPRAQEMVGFMHLYGPALYGAEVPRDRDQARYWLQRAASAGSAVAAHALRRAPGKPAHADASISARSRSE